MADHAIPILTGRHLADTVAFYVRLGFEHVASFGNPPHYAIVHRGTVAIHFVADASLDPARNGCQCYLMLDNPDATHAAFAAAGLPPHGIPRLEPVEDKPWGMREFALIDADGNLLRAGRRMGAG